MDATRRTRDVVGRYFAALVAREWDALGELVSADVTYEMPQTRERITGRAKYVQFNREYPGDWAATLTRLIADGTTAAASLNFTVGDQELVSLQYVELQDGLITRITDFWPERYDPPAGREHLVERVPAAIDRLSAP